jgi:uncharacterized membrane protein YkvA (DUF1232 family)
VRGLARALPDVLRLIYGLAREPRLPRSVKIAIAAAAIYLASPVDLIPDVVPLAGLVDDLLLAAIVLDGVLSYVDRAMLLRYWPGSVESLDRVARVARFLAAWVPHRLKARIFSPRG